MWSLIAVGCCLSFLLSSFIIGVLLSLPLWGEKNCMLYVGPREACEYTVCVWHVCQFFEVHDPSFLLVLSPPESLALPLVIPRFDHRWTIGGDALRWAKLLGHLGGPRDVQGRDPSHVSIDYLRMFLGKFTGQPHMSMGKSMVSCRFSLKPIHLMWVHIISSCRCHGQRFKILHDPKGLSGIWRPPCQRTAIHGCWGPSAPMALLPHAQDWFGRLCESGAICVEKTSSGWSKASSKMIEYIYIY